MAPVHIIVGTTLATAAVVIGTGYVFKKFIYDPHLSHHVEAFLATHQHILNGPHLNENDHHPSNPPGSTQQQPAPVPPSKGSSTAYQDQRTRTTLRHRGRPSVSDPLTQKNSRSSEYGYEYELEESQQSRQSREGLIDREAEAGVGIAGYEDKDGDMRRGASVYELDESRLSLLGAHKSTSLIDPIRRSGGGGHNLIDMEGSGMMGLDRPDSPQDAEVREVIFKLSHTPDIQSRSSTPASFRSDKQAQSNNVNPFLSPEDPSSSSSSRQAHPLSRSYQARPSPRAELSGIAESPSDAHESRAELMPPAPSTTFSFLSLSQQSSPEQLHPHLDSLSFSSAFPIPSPLEVEPDHNDRLNELEQTPTLPDDNDNDIANDDEDDIISLPETSTTSYEDAESYTPISRALSPAVSADHHYHHHHQPASAIPVQEPISEYLGLNHIPLAQHGSGFTPGNGGPVSLPRAGVATGSRGPMSVISVSGSEAEVEAEEEGDGEWDVVSEAGR
ncbi:hypothetical protein IAT40_004728 [Kwoniella sp. CBS 6097]